MISLLIPTHNGASTLPRVLAAIARLDVPADGIEVIAVDNASTDSTSGILQDFAGRLPMKILLEPRRGKSFALNRGMEAARGELIVFTDDDVIPEVDWLVAFATAAANHTEAAIFAGQVRHCWDSPPPRWLHDLAAEGLSFGGTPINLREGSIAPEQAKGANLMVRYSALGGVRFAEDECLNFRGENESAGGEDSRFVRDVTERSGTAYYVPRACVRHIVRTDQVGLRAVVRRYIRIGRSQPLRRDAGPTILGFSARGLSRILRHAVTSISRLALGRPTDAARQVVYLAFAIGQVLEGRKKGRQ